MTTWYLIIIILDLGSYSSQQTIEFKDQAQCEQVRDEIRKAVNLGWTKNYIECRSDWSK